MNYYPPQEEVDLAEIACHLGSAAAARLREDPTIIRQFNGSNAFFAELARFAPLFLEMWNEHAARVDRDLTHWEDTITFFVNSFIEIGYNYKRKGRDIRPADVKLAVKESILFAYDLHFREYPPE